MRKQKEETLKKKKPTENGYKSREFVSIRVRHRLIVHRHKHQPGAFIVRHVGERRLSDLYLQDLCDGSSRGISDLSLVLSISGG